MNHSNTRTGFFPLRMRSEVYKIIFLILFCPLWSMGQGVLSGQVKGPEGIPVPDAEVYIQELQNLTDTDNRGNYSFSKLKPGTYTVLVFAFEYQVWERKVNIEGNQILNVTLQPLAEELSEVVLTAEREKVFALKQLKKVEGTAIYAGKKSEVILLENIVGNLASNNPRQIYNQVVGLNIYENSDAGIQLNIGGRGLDPNRSANFNTRQNGYDISADALGYPESYYTPPAEALSEIQVVRGAASLQYGPQFGGLLNFKFKRPVQDKKIEWISRQTVGSYGLRTSFNSLSGKASSVSYYSYFNYKEGEGFRPNTNFDSRNFHIHLDFALSEKTELALEATVMNYLAQQPGGLTDAQFLENPGFSNRTRNWFDLDWNVFSLMLKHRLSAKSDFSLNLFGMEASRKALGFRTNRVSQPDDLTAPRELLVDDFRNWGAEMRWLTRYTLKAKENVLLLGAKYYQTDNNQQQGPGSNAANADFSFRTGEFPDYERQSQFEFPNLNLAFFGENIFNITDSFSLTPGFRFEYIKTQSEGSYRNIVLDLAGNPLLNEEIEDNRIFERNFLLLGLGLSYKKDARMELYGNFSQNYRSVTFSDIRVINPSFQVDENISDENGFTADLGIRGRLGQTLSYDISSFGLLYDDRLGEILKNETRINAQGELVETGRVVRFRGNIGTAFIYGIEGFADYNLASFLLPGREEVKLNYFANLAITGSEYLDSEENNVEGNQVEFIPTLNLKTGINFGWKNLLGSVQYAYLSEQFTDATNAPQDVNDNQRGIEGAIPSYDILDVSLSYTLKNWRLEAGVNNILNRTYFTRRATGYPGPGIIPADPVTFYTTLQFKL